MAIKSLLAKKYGDTVDIAYVDITDKQIDDFPEIKKHIENPGTPLPIIAFDDAPAWAGAVSFPHIVQELTRRGFEQK